MGVSGGMFLPAVLRSAIFFYDRALVERGCGTDEPVKEQKHADAYLRRFF
jgi:hypothetical protein